jgi:hypothetical protein
VGALAPPDRHARFAWAAAHGELRPTAMGALCPGRCRAHGRAPLHVGGRRGARASSAPSNSGARAGDKGYDWLPVPEGSRDAASRCLVGWPTSWAKSRREPITIALHAFSLASGSLAPMDHPGCSHT